MSIHYIAKSIGSPPSNERFTFTFMHLADAFIQSDNSYLIRINLTGLQTLEFGNEFLAQGLHVKSHQRCSAGIRTWLSADQSSSSTLTES